MLVLSLLTLCLTGIPLGVLVGRIIGERHTWERLSSDVVYAAALYRAAAERVGGPFSKAEF